MVNPVCIEVRSPNNPMHLIAKSPVTTHLGRNHLDLCNSGNSVPSLGHAEYS